MIGKKIPNPKKGSKSARIANLLDYLAQPENHQDHRQEHRHEKCTYLGARGFITESQKGRIKEMQALAHEAVRSADPINHYMFSWRAGEKPTTAQIEEAMDIMLKEMGMEGHQVVYGLHEDTDNVHLHVVLNRVHPENGKVIAINKGFDKEALHRVIARIEHAQGWSREQRGRYQVKEDGTLERSRPVNRDAAPEPSQRSLDREHRTGAKSAERIAQEGAARILETAKSWQEVHEQLAAINMRYERQGSGAVVYVGHLAVKASKVSRQGSIAKMQQRLGPFEAQGEHHEFVRHTPKDKPYPGPTRSLSEHRMRTVRECSLAPNGEVGEKPARILSYLPRPSGRGDQPLRREGSERLTPQPIQPGNKSLAEYHALREEYRRKRDAKKEELRARHQTEKGRLKEKQTAQRKHILEGHNWMNKGELKNAMASVLASEQAAERAALTEKQRLERQQLAEELPPFPGFEQWLKEQGREAEVEAWKQRLSAKKEMEQVNGFAPPPMTEYVPPMPPQDIRAFAPKVRGEDEVAYSRQDAPADAPPAFVDKGIHIDVHDDSKDSTLAALQLAQQKWGEVTITGDDEFKAKCVALAVEHGIEIKNPELRQAVEQERQRLAAEVIPGYQPQHQPEPAMARAPEPEQIPEPKTRQELEAARAKLIDELDAIGRNTKDKSMSELMEATRPLHDQLGQIDVKLNEMDRQQRQAEAMVKEHEARMQPPSNDEIVTLERERDGLVRKIEALTHEDIPITEMMAQNRMLSEEITKVEVKIDHAIAQEAERQQLRRQQREMEQKYESYRRDFPTKILRDGQRYQGVIDNVLHQHEGKEYVAIVGNKGERYLPRVPGIDAYVGKELHVEMNDGKIKLLQNNPQKNDLNEQKQTQGGKQKGISVSAPKKGMSM